MFAVPALHRGLSRSRALAGARFAAVFMAATAGSAFALDPQAAVPDSQRSRLQVTTSTLPRFDNADGATRSSRIDMTLLPARRSGIGLAVGMTSLSGSAPGGLAPFAPGAPTVDLGLHWRYLPDSNYRLDVTAWRRMQNADAISMIQSQDPSYGARLEMGFGSASRLHKGFVADRGFVGLQLESGGRITVRRSHGSPMLYYRNNF